MTARSIGEIVAGKGPSKVRRTFQPVRRDSRHRGEREGRIWRPLGHNRQARRFKAAVLQAAEAYELGGRKGGKENGPLGHIGLEVLRFLFRIVDHKTGRLEPAIATICERINRSRDAVVRALARLKAHGFVDWIRRTEPTDNDGAGPQVRQITNAYGFDILKLPRSSAAWVRRVLSNGPPPDCETARREQDQADVEAMLGAMPLADQARFLADGDLGEALARLASALDRGASHSNGQNPGHGG